MLDYKLLEALALVIQAGGFERAAQELHITQSAVSQRIKLLEDQIGQILVARTSPPKATSAGRNLLKHYLLVKHMEDDLFTTADRHPQRAFTSLTIALNADSLATWFFDAIQPFLIREEVLLDILVDDQEQTHQLLKNGEVVGCITTQSRPLQGCRISRLGSMHYHLLAAPEFAQKWFPHGLSLADAHHAPAVIYNRKDELHDRAFQQIFGKAHENAPAHYVPSSEKFVDFILGGLGYGMLPAQQADPFIRTGKLLDLAPDHHVEVKLYWHCWNLKSRLLDELSNHLASQAKQLLATNENRHRE